MTGKAFNTSDVPRFRRVMTVILEYIIPLHKSECSVRVLINVLLEYINLNIFALKIFVCLNVINSNICNIRFTSNFYSIMT